MTEEKVTDNRFDKKFIIKSVMIVLLVISFLYLYNYFDLGSKINREEIESFLKPFGFWVPVAYVLLFVAAMIFYVPSALLLIVGGSIFGPVWGVFWGALASIVSGIVLFLIAKIFDYSFIKNKLGKKWETFNSKIEKNGMVYIFFMRASSLFPFALIGYGSAITSVKLKDYIIGTVFGVFPIVFMHAYITPLILLSGKMNLDDICILGIMVSAWLVSAGSFYFISYRKQIKFLRIRNS